MHKQLEKGLQLHWGRSGGNFVEALGHGGACSSSQFKYSLGQMKEVAVHGYLVIYSPVLRPVGLDLCNAISNSNSLQTRDHFDKSRALTYFKATSS